MYQINLRQLMSNQAIDYSSQNQIIEHITGQPLHIIMTWGINLEQIPPLFQGMVIGYFQGCREIQAALQAQQMENLQQMAMYTSTQTAAIYTLGQVASTSYAPRR
jgi:hypothetical protein